MPPEMTAHIIGLIAVLVFGLGLRWIGRKRRA